MMKPKQTSQIEIIKLFDPILFETHFTDNIDMSQTRYITLLAILATAATVSPFQSCGRGFQSWDHTLDGQSLDYNSTPWADARIQSPIPYTSPESVSASTNWGAQIDPTDGKIYFVSFFADQTWNITRGFCDLSEGFEKKPFYKF